MLTAPYSLGTFRVPTTGILNITPWGDNPAAHKIRINADNVTITCSKIFYIDIYNRKSVTDDAPKNLKNISITKSMFNPGLIAVAGRGIVSNLIISNNLFRNNYSTGTSWSTRTYCFLVIDCRVPGMANTASNGDIYRMYEWVVQRPVIQNNTFYNRANLAVRAGRLYNNIFFYTTSTASDTERFGLPVWLGTSEHDTKNNIIYNGVVWKNPQAHGSSLTDFGRSYGNMLNDGNNIYYGAAGEQTWFAGSAGAPDKDKSFMLTANSPARDKSGDDTRQRGMFGGADPYVLSGLFTIPAIWEIKDPERAENEDVPSSGFDLRVRVKPH
jgi:hypothetical protein